MKEYLSTAEGVRQMWEKINGVLDNFDFNKVVTVMEALDWYWKCDEDQADDYEELGNKVRRCGIGWEYRPEYRQLVKFARERIVGAIESMPDDEVWWAEGSGGFRAEVSICTDDERADYYGGEIANVDDFMHSVDIRLSFEVEEYSSY